MYRNYCLVQNLYKLRKVWLVNLNSSLKVVNLWLIITKIWAWDQLASILGSYCSLT